MEEILERKRLCSSVEEQQGSSDRSAPAAAAATGLGCWDAAPQMPPVLIDELFAGRKRYEVAMDLANLAIALGKRGHERCPMLQQLLEQATGELVHQAERQESDEGYSACALPPADTTDVHKMSDEQQQRLLTFLDVWAPGACSSDAELACWLGANKVSTKPRWMPWGLFREVRRAVAAMEPLRPPLLQRFVVENCLEQYRYAYADALVYAASDCQRQLRRQLRRQRSAAAAVAKTDAQAEAGLEAEPAAASSGRSGAGASDSGTAIHVFDSDGEDSDDEVDVDNDREEDSGGSSSSSYAAGGFPARGFVGLEAANAAECCVPLPSYVGPLPRGDDGSGADSSYAMLRCSAVMLRRLSSTEQDEKARERSCSPAAAAAAAAVKADGAAAAAKAEGVVAAVAAAAPAARWPVAGPVLEAASREGFVLGVAEDALAAWAARLLSAPISPAAKCEAGEKTLQLLTHLKERHGISLHATVRQLATLLAHGGDALSLPRVREAATAQQ